MCYLSFTLLLCEQLYRSETMPSEQSTSSVDIVASIAVFLVVTLVCWILSLATTAVLEPKHSHAVNILLPYYIPDIAMIFVMSVGIVAMVVFIIKRADFTADDHESNNRHKLHRTYSLVGITVFFIGVCILGINYIVVEFFCEDRWTGCYDSEVVLVNVFELLFRIVFVAFASFEIIVCWILKGLNFKRSRWVWLGLAIVQAANVALWFDSVLNESFHRINDNVHSFDAYFSLCNTTHDGQNQTETRCSQSSFIPQWFIFSSPFLYPITIEFALLVSETFLRKIIGTRQTNSGDGNSSTPNARHNNDGDNPTERTPLLSRENENPHERTPHSANSNCKNIFILISGIINIAYLVLSVLMFIGNQVYTSNSRPTYFQTFINLFVVFKTLYMMYLIIGCVVGMQYSWRKLKRERSHTSFLEYLLLFATAGGLCRTFKRIVAYAVNSDSSGHWVIAYYISEVVDVIEVVLQMVFYYYAKDVRLSRDGEPADSLARVRVFKSIIIVIAMSNFAAWMSDSFLHPEMSTSITPSDYLIESWPVFDNIVTPIVIFFRFNSALLFWCIKLALVCRIAQTETRPRRHSL